VRLIAAGRVCVAGAVCRTPARRIDPRRDAVTLDGRPVGEATERVVLAFHKPVGLVTTRVDPGGRPTVYDALAGVGRWVFPVGRLDRDSSGLLILTNDHRLGERLTSPDQHVAKTYHARVRGVPDRAALAALREGLMLDDGTTTRPAAVRELGSARGAGRAAGAPAAETSAWLEIVLTEGRNRQVRRMCAAVGHEVLELVRVRIGRLELGSLAPGEWRELAPADVDALADRPPGPGRRTARGPRPGRV
jgi:23S rRNA pseudouridine2605 synthase